MASTTTQRRKGGGPPKSQDGVVKVAQVIGDQPINGINNNDHQVTPLLKNVPVPLSSSQQAPTAVATVRRNKCGTGPFDENWLNLDCCGLFCAGITYMLHMYGVYAVCTILLPPWMSVTDENGIRSLTFMGHFHRFAFTMVAILAVAAHFKAMTTDPGAVPPDAIPLEEQPSANSADVEMGQDPPPTEMPEKSPRKRRLCRRCHAFKPERAHHCSVCKRCVIKMDHHCPWVNNCVGIGNHKYFLLFVFYTFASCLYSFTLVVVRFFSCMGRHGHLRSHHLACLDNPSQLLNILGLLVEAILFGLFTACMMIDQAGVVTTKMTHIDRLKGGDDGAGSSLAGIIEVFGLNTNMGNPANQKRNADGSRFRPDWLSPFAKVCFPQSLQDEIMGFCRPCLGGGGKNAETELMSPRNSSTAQMIRSVQEIV